METIPMVKHAHLLTNYGNWGAKDSQVLSSSHGHFYACKNQKCTHFQILKTHFPSYEI